MKANRYFLSVLAVLLLTGGLSVLLLRADREDDFKPKEQLPVHVQTVLVEMRDLQPSIRLKGQFKPAQQVWLHSEISGQIIERRVEPGQRVQVGDLLLRLEEGDWRDSLAHAQAQLDSEQSAVQRDRRLHALMEQQTNLIEQQAKRLEHLQQDALASASNYDQTRQDLLQRQIELERLEHNVRTSSARLTMLKTGQSQAQRNLQRSQLQAPFSGTVNQVAVTQGDYVSPSMKVVELVRIDELDLHLEIPGSIAMELKRGMKIELQTNGTQHLGQIIAIESAPDTRTHTHALRIRAEAARELRPGQIAEAILPGRALHSVSTIPITAVLREEGGNYVFRVTQKHQLQQVPIQILWQQDDLVALEGIAPGTHIVANNVTELAPGQAVTPVPL